MSFTDSVGIPRRTMVLFFVVDTSGSMQGNKIGAVNDAIRETLPDLQDLSKNNADAKIKIATLQFDSNVQWRDIEPVDSENFVWNDLQAGGLTSLGAALLELKDKLSVKKFMQEAVGSFAPVIIFMSDGAPTDEYKAALEEAKKNNWFKHAIKIAIAIGNDADKSVLTEVVGNTEAVIDVHNKETLKKLIRFVSVTSSQVNSKSSGVDDTTKSDKVIEQIQDFVDTENINDIGDDEW